MRLGINARFLTQNITGVQRYARELTGELVKLLNPEWIRLMAPESAPPMYAGVKVHRYRYGNVFPGHVWEQVVLPIAIRNRCDILLCPGNTGPVAVTNQIVVIHDMAVFSRPNGFNPHFVRWYRMLLPRLARRVRRIITVSEFSRQEILKHLQVSLEKVVVASNGVSERFMPVSDEATAFRKIKNLPDRFVLGLASRAPNKNFTGLLHAWHILSHKEKFQDVWLVIAGGASRTLLTDQTDTTVKKLPRVCDVGYVDDNDLPSLYSAAEVFVFPSFYEGFGLPPLEAMACGTPVVVSNVASLPEVVGDAGVYVDPYDVNDIAHGIYRVLTDEDLRLQLRKKGLERAKLFTWKKTAQQTLEVLKEVIVQQGRK